MTTSIPRSEVEYAHGWKSIRKGFIKARDPITQRIQRVLKDSSLALPKVEGIDYTTESGTLTYASLLYNTPESARDAFTSDVLHPIVYLRDGHPYGQILTKALLVIDPAASAGRVTAFGMGAIAAALLSVNAGGHIVASKHLFGTTKAKLSSLKRERNIDVTFVDGRNTQEWQAAVQPGRTQAFFYEPVANPGMEVIKTATLSEIAHKWDILVIADNSATPLDQSLTQGADIVAFSTTKFLGLGKHSGGAVLLSQEGLARLAKRFPGQSAGFPIFNEVSRGGLTQAPGGSHAMLGNIGVGVVRHYSQIETATIVAKWIAANATFKVHSPNLVSDVSPQEHSQLFSIDFVQQERAFRFINALAPEGIFSVNNFGGPRTTVVHPGTTTQMALSPEEQHLQGISPGLVRVSVGVERSGYLREVFDRALHCVIA